MMVSVNKRNERESVTGCSGSRADSVLLSSKRFLGESMHNMCLSAMVCCTILSVYFHSVTGNYTNVSLWT